MTKPPKRIVILGCTMISLSVLGVFANVYNVLFGHDEYSPLQNFLFAILKGLGLVAGILVLKMYRLGALLFGASIFVGMLLAVMTTGPYPFSYWLGACVMSVVMLAFVWLVIRKDWKQMQSLWNKGEQF